MDSCNVCFIKIRSKHNSNTLLSYYDFYEAELTYASKYHNHAILWSKSISPRFPPYTKNRGIFFPQYCEAQVLLIITYIHTFIVLENLIKFKNIWRKLSRETVLNFEFNSFFRQSVWRKVKWQNAVGTTENVQTKLRLVKEITLCCCFTEKCKQTSQFFTLFSPSCFLSDSVYWQFAALKQWQIFPNCVQKWWGLHSKQNLFILRNLIKKVLIWTSHSCRKLVDRTELLVTNTSEDYLIQNSAPSISSQWQTKS